MFLDTADGVRLTVISGNLGLDRPIRGFDDDVWRYAIKKIALQRKNIRAIFERVLEVCEGPQYARTGTLAEDVIAGDTVITLNDASSFLQIGKLVLDPGQVTEEEVEFCFRDLVTNEINLESPLQFNHLAKDFTDVTNTLREPIVSGATTIPLIDSSLFPTAGFPYSIVIGRGTEQEEAVIVTANDTVLNELTTFPTTLDHEGPKTRFLRRELLDPAPAGRTFIQLDINDTREFPASGLIVIDRNGGSEELIFYTDNDTEGNTLRLKTPLASAHAAAESVELLTEGANVDLANVWQQGLHWQIYQTTPRKVTVFLPPGPEGALRLIDASWIHDVATQSPASTTLAVAAAAGDTEIELTSAVGFPDEASVIDIGGVETAFYIFRDEAAVPNPILRLTEPLTSPHLAGTTVDVLEFNYPGTNLKEGNLRDAAGNVITGRFPGPYVYDATQRGVSETKTELATLIAAPTRVARDQIAARTCLEVVGASDMPPPPFEVVLGRSSGDQETTTVVDVTLAAGTSTTVVTGGLGSITLTVAASAAFPESSNGLNNAGYRLIIDAGGGNEEIVEVAQNDTGANIFTLTSPLTIAHAAAETVDLINDVITTDVLTEAHTGQDLSVSELGHLVEVLYEEIDLVSGVGFPPDGGFVWINFGKARVNARSTIVSFPGAAIFELTSTDNFPTTDFPYKVILGEGTSREEFANVIANDTVLDQLTFSAPPNNTHIVGTNVRFVSGDPEVVEYVDRDVDTLQFAAPMAFGTGHTIGETVILSTDESIPGEDGYDYAFLMPPDFTNCLTFLFNLVRAAGIEVEIVSER